MSNNKLKLLAKAVQYRNPEMRYTKARRLAKQMPQLLDPRSNLLVGGGTGTGATVALKAFAARAVDEGSRIALISVKESWGTWLSSKADIAVTTMYSPDDCAEQGYVKSLSTVVPGTIDSPLFLVLDNFEYVNTPRRDGEPSALVAYDGQHFLMNLMSKSPYTCVALRTQSSLGLAPAMSRNMCNRLWMGHGSNFHIQSFFGKGISDLVTSQIPRGRGFLQQVDHDMQVVDIPFDPAVQRL